MDESSFSRETHYRKIAVSAMSQVQSIAFKGDRLLGEREFEYGLACVVQHLLGHLASSLALPIRRAESSKEIEHVTIENQGHSG